MPSDESRDWALQVLAQRALFELAHDPSMDVEELRHEVCAEVNEGVFCDEVVPLMDEVLPRALDPTVAQWDLAETLLRDPDLEEDDD